MCRRTTGLAVLVLLLGHGMIAQADVGDGLKGLWEFSDADDLAAATVGNDLVLAGDMVQTAMAGVNASDGAVSIGVGSYYECTAALPANGGGSYVNEYTLLFDIKYPASSTGQWHCFFQTNTSNSNDGDYFIHPSDESWGVAAIGYTDNASVGEFFSSSDTWYRVVMSVHMGNTDAYLKLFIDGVLVATHTSGLGLDGRHSLYAEPDVNILLFADESGEDAEMHCSTLAIWDRPLTEEEATALGNAGDTVVASGMASELNPSDGATDILRDVVLAWRPGEFAATHDVYLGTNFDDVNDASRDNPLDVLVSQGRAETTYDAGRLTLGQTYYWRVDEVNAAPDKTIFKGDVWSFTTEVVAYPVSGVTATTNAASQDGSGPEKMVDGSGLNASDQHSDVTTDMWQAQAGDADPVQIDFAFDKVYCLYEILVWNSNTQFETMLGFGLQNVTVEYSADGETWTVLGDVDLAEGTGMSDYTANTTIDFGGVAAQFVKFTVNSRHSDSMLFGLSEVRFLYIPAYASQPAPADGDADVSIDTALAWRPGRQVVSHEVYLGTDPNALPLAGIVDAATFTPDALDLAMTYYWRIDEVNDAEAVSLWQGDLWNFSTQDYIVVEDFESYNDDDNLIYETWIDGWYNGTGSTVGYFEAPFAETVIVHSGAQSMPLTYSNVGVATSTADFELSQDWTGNGIQSLSLYFHGSAGNTGRLYVKINDTKFSYDGEADDIAKETWLPWNIDLTTAGVNVSTVTMLSIGVEGAGTGVVYFDDLRLYPSAPESVEPIAPDDSDTSLVGLWKLDDGGGTVVTDSSGNNHNGVFHGAPQWIAGGVAGGALQLDGADDHVVLGSIDYGDSDFSVALWVKTDGWNDDAAMISNKDWNSGSNVGWLMAGGAGNNGSWQWNFSDGAGRADFDPSVDLCRVAGGQWHHLCVTHDRDGLAMFYYDGVLIGQQDISTISGSLDAGLPTVLGTDGAEGAVWAYWFAGVFDDVRIYNRVLSNGEVAGLTGRTAPLYQGF